MRARLVLVVFALIACACSSAKPTPSDPQAMLRRAATRSLAESSATIRGRLGRDSVDLVAVSGVVDFRDRRTSVVHDALNGQSYPSFEARLVGGWSYVEIDSVVRRPPTVRPDVRWIAYQKSPGYLPIPDRMLLPAIPIDFIEWAANKSVSEPRLTNEPDGVRIEVQFADPKLHGMSCAYTVDRSGRITGISTVDQSHQTTSLTYVYGGSVPDIREPPAGRVQRLGTDEVLYPTTTTTR